MNWFEKMVQETEEEREEATQEEKTPLRPRIREEVAEHQILSTDDIPSYRPIPLYENERWPGNRHRRQPLEQRHSNEQTRTKRAPKEQEASTPSRAFRPSEVPSPIFGMRQKPEMPELSKEAREVRTRKHKPKGKATGDITQIEEKLTPLHDEKKQSFVEQEQQMIARDVKETEEEPIQNKVPPVIEQEDEKTREEQPSPIEAIEVEEVQPSPIEAIEVEEVQPSPIEAIEVEEEQPSPIEAIEVEEEQPSHDEVIEVEEVQPSHDEVIEAEELQPSSIETTEVEEESDREEVQLEQTEQEEIVRKEQDELSESVTVLEEEQQSDEADDEEESTLPFNVLMLSSDKRKLEMAEKIKRARRNV